MWGNRIEQNENPGILDYWNNGILIPTFHYPGAIKKNMSFKSIIKINR